MKKRLFFVFLVFLLLIPNLLDLWVDYLWFESVGYLSVFLTILSTKLLLGIVGFAVVTVFLYVNLKLAGRFSRVEDLRLNVRLAGFKVFGILALLSGLIAGFALSTGWETYLKFLNSVPFNKMDPVFAKDLAFYVFKLPFYDLVLNYSLGIVVAGLALVGGVYLYIMRKKMEAEEDFQGVVSQAKKHVSVLLGFLFLILAGKVYLSKFGLLFSSRGAVFGAAYTDLNIMLPVILISTVLSLVTGMAFLLNLKLERIRYPTMAVLALVAVLILGNITGAVVQSYTVEPNEYNLEKDYIRRNINMTLDAYDLSDMDERQFLGSYNLSSSDLEERPETVKNIRLWDWRALKDTYSQLQLIRTYYNFEDVDIDRYRFNGQYKQVMLSSREMNQDQLPQEAKTWTNRHLVYTHGLGVVMSPVSEISEQGLPIFYMKDIPPKVTDSAPEKEPLNITNPDIYYGEGTDDYVVTGTTTEEFDYPRGGENIYTTYGGTGGVEVGGFLNKLALAFHLGDLRLLVSGSVKSDSEVLFRRNIRERVERISPFLDYDRDPYSVVEGGQIHWIYDAYTTTENYPYSEPVNALGKTNYIRNSVKVTVDAYSGKVNYHVIDQEDPLVRTYEKIFPEMFEDFDDMDQGLKGHVRYPEDLFRIQSKLYSTYHMKDPRVFYNKEDKWTMPRELYKGRSQAIEPYYVILELPKENQTQFVLMMPFTPQGKDNMIAWMGAKSDMPDYGEKVLYKFSKQRLIYGPNQVESRITQDADISQQITLWSQAGSEVIRGNLLVIPVKDSILYVEPLFLRSSEDAIPELKRVIVAFGDDIAMRPTLKGSLEVIFGEAERQPAKEERGKITPEQQKLIDRAQKLYQRAQSHLKQGNLSAYGEDIEALGSTLEKIGS